MEFELIESINKMIVNGNRFELPKDDHFDNYAQVKKCLIAAGGKYKKCGFEFAGDVQEIKNRLMRGEDINDKKNFNFFPTPQNIAFKMIALAGSMAGFRILEPSAGTGVLVSAAINAATGNDCCSVVAIEINSQLFEGLKYLRQKTLYSNESNFQVINKDFLECNGGLGTFHKIIMNPPFKNGIDIKHIEHALTFLNPGGRLVALCANGPRQRYAFMDRASRWEDLPDGSFKESGTNVNVALMVIDN